MQEDSVPECRDGGHPVRACNNREALQIYGSVAEVHKNKGGSGKCATAYSGQFTVRPTE